MPALRLQVLQHGHHHRGFAGAARNHIADHDDRHAGMAGFENARLIERSAQRYQEAIEQ